jgi:putative heme utilization carrier protein HutX
MSAHMTAATSPLAALLARNPDGVLERIAEEHGVSTLAVVEALPASHRTIVSGAAFEDIMATLTTWGDVLMIVHTPDIVLECEGRIPQGTIGRGYFNLHGESPIGGHIRHENCRAIAFVDRPFMGRRSCSLQFFNAAGAAMFKVFVRRDERRELVATQADLFEKLRRSHEPTT